MNMGYEEFHCNHVQAGMVSVIQLMIVFAVLLQIMDSEHLPTKRIRKPILEVINDHDLAPLIWKCFHTGNNTQEYVNKRKHIEYDHKRAESSVTSSLRGHSG